MKGPMQNDPAAVKKSKGAQNSMTEDVENWINVQDKML